MTTDDTVIRLNDVTVSFGEQSILRGITFDVARGSTVAIIGESGCGKSVTLKTVVGLILPDRGSVSVNGSDVARLSESQRIAMRLKVGFLFQGAALFDSMNVGDNVAFGLRAQRKLDEKQIRERVEERVREVGLSESVLEKMPAELSGGMRKRVGLARALALDPDVMLYDEPTTGLDPLMSDVINDLILQTRRKRPITSIVVSHDMKTVMKVADRVVMFYPLSQLSATDPQVIYDGPPSGLLTHDDVRVRSFVEGDAHIGENESGSGYHRLSGTQPKV